MTWCIRHSHALHRDPVRPRETLSSSALQNTSRARASYPVKARTTRTLWPTRPSSAHSLLSVRKQALAPAHPTSYRQVSQTLVRTPPTPSFSTPDDRTVPLSSLPALLLPVLPVLPHTAATAPWVTPTGFLRALPVLPGRGVTSVSTFVKIVRSWRNRLSQRIGIR